MHMAVLRHDTDNGTITRNEGTNERRIVVIVTCLLCVFKGFAQKFDNRKLGEEGQERIKSEYGTLEPFLSSLICRVKGKPQATNTLFMRSNR